MKQNTKHRALFLLSLFMLLAVALVSMLLVNASEYCTIRVNYLFENGETAYDAYVAVVEKGQSVDITVNHPIISGYKAVDSLDADAAQPAQSTRITRDVLDEDLTLEIYYVPDVVPYKVKYFMQNIYDDDYTADRTLPEDYYYKTGLTGTFPEDLENLSFTGFTKLYHKPDFIAADSSTEFELYFTRNYYLINFDLNGGYGVEPVYAKYQYPYHIAEPKREGYVFQGWVLCDKDGNYVDADGNILTEEQALEQADPFTDGVVPAQDMSYKAVWEAELADYSVVYLFETVDNSGVVDENGRNYMVIGAKDIVKQVYSGETVSAHDDFYEGIDLDNATIDDMDKKIIPKFRTVYHDMSDAQIKQLWNRNRFDFNEELSTKEAIVKGDGTTRLYVYYDRKVYKQRFFFCREDVNETDETKKYEIAGYTKSFSMTDTTDLTPEEGLQKHLLMHSSSKALNAWMQIVTEKPQVFPEYLNREDYPVVEKCYPENGSLYDPSTGKSYIYWYWEFDTKYYENMHDTWLQHALMPTPLKSVYNGKDYTGHAAGFGAWSVEWNAYYPDGQWDKHATTSSNRTCKGIYETLDEQLMRNDNDTTLNYLAFWTDAKNADWNGKNWTYEPPSENKTIYIFNYLNYVEVLPEEVDAVKQAIAEGKDEITQETGEGSHNILPYTYKRYLCRDGKYYKLHNDEVVETFDAGDQYNNVNTRDANVRKQQTHTKLDGYAYDKDKTEVYWDRGKDEVYGLNVVDVSYFYSREKYTLKFRNHNIKDEAENEQYYFEETIAASPHKTGTPVYPVEDLARYYTFAGWYYSPLYLEKVDFDTFIMPDEDVTFYAKWVPTTEHVTFYADYDDYKLHPADTKLSEADVPYNTLILTEDIPSINKTAGRPLLEPPVSGATFTGWYYVDETGTELRFEPENMPVVKGMELYAKWTSEQSAGYRVEFVEKGSDTPVASPETGVAFITTTKSFRAKVNEELNEAHRPKEGEKNWWPVVSSHSILIKPNTIGSESAPNTYRFEYYKKASVWYKVRYLDATTLEPLAEDKISNTSSQLVSEAYLPLEGYLPDSVIKTLAPAASVSSDPAQAKAEELEQNTIVFLYTQNDTQMLIRIEHMLQNVDGNADNKQDYVLYRTQRIKGQLNEALDLEKDIYQSEIAAQLTDNHFIINKDFTEINDEPYDGGEIILDGSPLVIRVYYRRGLYPYKVICADVDSGQELKTTVYSDDADLQPLGAEVSIIPENPLILEEQQPTRGDAKKGAKAPSDNATYLPVTDAPQALTIYHEDIDPDNPDPKMNVKTLYYKRQTGVRLDYQIVCKGAVPGDLTLSQNYENVMTADQIKGCTAADYSGAEGRYTFLGWYRLPEATSGNLLTDAHQYTPELPLNDTTYYAIFEINSAPYTVNYVYQGRAGGNEGSYVGDDNADDTKVYSKSMVLTSDQWDENGIPNASVLVENAPAIDDLYKDCVWTIDSDHITYDAAAHTVTITAAQTARKCAVEFIYGGDPVAVQLVPVNSLVMPDGKFVTAPETDGENPFAYWSVTMNGKETAKCFDREFNLRITGSCTVTACYGATAKAITISDAVYTREVTTGADGKTIDKLYADFILAYMEENGKLLNPNFANHTEDDYQTGLIVEYDASIMLEKADAPGATLSDEEKVVYPEGDVLSAEDAKTLAGGGSLSGTEHRYLCYGVANNAYNNHNRVDRTISFVNSATARHLVLRAYYYVWNKSANSFEMTAPVCFYLYDIGNSEHKTN